MLVRCDGPATASLRLLFLACLLVHASRSRSSLTNSRSQAHPFEHEGPGLDLKRCLQRLLLGLAAFASNYESGCQVLGHPSKGVIFSCCRLITVP